MDTQTKVAYACNILSMEGHTDTIYGHVSARVENAEQIWINPPHSVWKKYDRMTC